MKRFVIIRKYLKYFLNAKTKYNIHSPFVFDLVVDVINNRTQFEAYNKIESIRKELLSSKEIICISDFGAGSTINLSNQRLVKDVAKNSAKSAKYGKLLYRIVSKFKPRVILELGTSLGISTLYQAMPDLSSKVITLEGCPETAQIATKNFEKVNIGNVEQVVGDFDETLSFVIEKEKSLDYVFFDGNHRKEPTLRYFELCVEKTNNESVFVFDDIHWSDEMEEAWKVIKDHPKVTITLDLFFIGIVFFRKEQKKEHFEIRY